jgi:uncharacterized protein (DUF885 family)
VRVGSDDGLCGYTRLLIKAETIAYHEGVPGHHMQIADSAGAASTPALPPKRVLHCIHRGLGILFRTARKEVGFYQDPYSYSSYLQNDMLRAIRLVVDTGVHSKQRCIFGL